MSSSEPINDDVVKKPDAGEKSDAGDPADGEELRFTPEEEEVGPLPAMFLSFLDPHHSIFELCSFECQANSYRLW